MLWTPKGRSLSYSNFCSSFFPFYIYCKSGIDFFIVLFLVLVFPFGLQINKLKTTKKGKKIQRLLHEWLWTWLLIILMSLGAFLFSFKHDCSFYRGTVLYSSSLSLFSLAVGFRSHLDLTTQRLLHHHAYWQISLPVAPQSSVVPLCLVKS